MTERVRKGRDDFNPEEDLPEGFNQVLMKKFFYSSLKEKDPCLEGILELLATQQYVTGDNIMGVRLCIDEALINAIRHGNKEDESKSVTVTVYGGSHAWGIRIEDEGEGFAVEDLPDYDSEEALWGECGRGVLLIREYMDEVYYYDRGNRVLMIKNFKKA